MFAGISLLARPAVVSAEPVTEVPVFEEFACLNCHSDQQQLAELAPAPTEEEEEESLSSGPG